MCTNLFIYNKIKENNYSLKELIKILQTKFNEVDGRGLFAINSRTKQYIIIKSIKYDLFTDINNKRLEEYIKVDQLPQGLSEIKYISVHKSDKYIGMNTKFNVILMHSRFATVASVHLDNVQPVINNDNKHIGTHCGTMRIAQHDPIIHGSDSVYMLSKLDISEQIDKQLNKHKLESGTWYITQYDIESDTLKVSCSHEGYNAYISIYGGELLISNNIDLVTNKKHKAIKLENGYSIIINNLTKCSLESLIDDCKVVELSKVNNINKLEVNIHSNNYDPYVDDNELYNQHLIDTYFSNDKKNKINKWR